MNPQTLASLPIVTASTLGDKLRTLEIGVLLGIRLAQAGRVTLDEVQRLGGYTDHTGALYALNCAKHVLPSLHPEATHATDGPRKEWVLTGAHLTK